MIAGSEIQDGSKLRPPAVVPRVQCTRMARFENRSPQVLSVCPLRRSEDATATEIYGVGGTADSGIGLHVVSHRKTRCRADAWAAGTTRWPVVSVCGGGGGDGGGSGGDGDRS